MPVFTEVVVHDISLDYFVWSAVYHWLVRFLIIRCTGLWWRIVCARVQRSDGGVALRLRARAGNYRAQLFGCESIAMAPASKKGTGKVARDRRSSSRHSTPLTDTTAPPTPLASTPSATSQPAPTLPRETPYLKTPTASLISSDLSLDTLIDRAHSPSLKPHDPPLARDLHTLHDKIRDNLLKSLAKRGETCERNLRAVVQKRKERVQVEREQEAAAAQRVKQERDGKKVGQKRSREEAEGIADGEGKKESVPAAGAHRLARQDGVGVHEGMYAVCSLPDVVRSKGVRDVAYTEGLRFTLRHAVLKWLALHVRCSEHYATRVTCFCFNALSLRKPQAWHSSSLHYHGSIARRIPEIREVGLHFLRRRTATTFSSDRAWHGSNRPNGYRRVPIRFRFITS